MQSELDPLREEIAAEIACRVYEYGPHEDSRTIAGAVIEAAGVERLHKEVARLRRKLKELGCEVIDDVDEHIAALTADNQEQPNA